MDRTDKSWHTDDKVIWYASSALKPWIPFDDTLSQPSVLLFSLQPPPPPPPLPPRPKHTHTQTHTLATSTSKKTCTHAHTTTTTLLNISVVSPLQRALLIFAKRETSTRRLLMSCPNKCQAVNNHMLNRQRTYSQRNHNVWQIYTLTVIKETMHERVQVSATRWFRWNWRIRLNSQSDNALWHWAEWHVYASVN